MGSADEDPGELPLPPVGETPPQRKVTRASRLSEATTVAPDATSPSLSSPPSASRATDSGDARTRKQERNKRRKQKRKTSLAQGGTHSGTREKAVCSHYKIHDSDSDEWQSVCSMDIYEDAISLHPEDDESGSDEFSSTNLKVTDDHQPLMIRDDPFIAHLKKHGNKITKRFIEDEERFEQEMDEMVIAELGGLQVVCTKNGNPTFLGTEQHPPIVEAARAGDINGITAILDNDNSQINERRMRKEIDERYGYDKEWSWWDDTALITAARSGHTMAVNLLLERKADPLLESCPVDDMHINAATAVKMSISVCKGTFMGMMKARKEGRIVPREEARQWQHFHENLEEILEILEESGGPAAVRLVTNSAKMWFRSDEEVESHLELCKNFLK